MPRYCLKLRPLYKIVWPGTFGHTREQAANHHHMGAGRERFGDVARVADAAVGDDRHSSLMFPGKPRKSPIAAGTPTPGNDSRRADGSGPNAHFDQHRLPLPASARAPFFRGHVAGNDVDAVFCFLSLPDASR